ncbi:MAG: zinc-dependent peptidase [Chitinophagaceae bacterium]
MTAIFFIILAFFLLVSIRSVIVSNEEPFLLKDIFNGYEEEYISNELPNTKDHYLYKGNELDLLHHEIETILNKYFIYYRNLDKHLQFKFFDRMIRFMHSKNFLIYSNEPFKEMPVLISAAAVQISFGLDEFELPHYTHIRVHTEEYFASNSLRILAGNVEGNCITLAWNHLLKGFYDYSDGNNVGLHEMAHALYFQEIIVDRDDPDGFANHFNQLMNDGETILEQNNCPHQLYSNYAFTNLQEFWAVSVELFFEKAEQLQVAYPNIFEHLRNILQQNPLIANQPV